MYKRRLHSAVSCLLLLLCLTICPGLQAAASPRPGILQAEDLQAESRAAIAQGKVYVLYISRPACPYCLKLEKMILMPMLQGHRFDEVLELRELSQARTEIRSFQGRKLNVAKILARYEILGTPTLLFLDEHGDALVEKISGFHSADFYWNYFDQAVQKSQLRLNSREKTSAR